MTTTPPPALPKNGKATAALILGIVALILAPLGIGALLGIVALILGVVALQKPPGKGKAIAGIVTGGLSIPIAAVVTLLVAILIPSLHKAREHHNQSRAMAGIQGISMGVMTYTAEWNQVPSHLADTTSYIPSILLRDPRISQQPLPPIPNDRATRIRMIDAESDFYFAIPSAKYPLRHTDQLIVVYDKPTAGRSRLLAFADGHTESLRPNSPELQKYIDATNLVRKASGLAPLPPNLSGPPPEFSATPER